MQKVVGSSPIIRSLKAPLRGFFVAEVGAVSPRCVPKIGAKMAASGPVRTVEWL
jgi:hypothetical protein